jgi:dienelactone hydrolase
MSEADSPTGLHLEATGYRPSLEGQHPVVMFHHGSTGPRLRFPTETERPDHWGGALASQGIALVAPMRRGRGRSGGRYLETYFGDLEPSRRGIQYGLESTYACEDFLRREQWVDPRRIVLAGTSRGGMLALWHAASRPGCCMGVIAFAPGWTSTRDASSQADVNLQLLDEIAGRIRVPILLLYANNDAYYPRAPSERYVERLCRSEAAVSAKWIDAPSGHRFFAESMEFWEESVDSFIATCFASPPATS